MPSDFYFRQDYAGILSCQNFYRTFASQIAFVYKEVFLIFIVSMVVPAIHSALASFFFNGFKE